MSPMDLATVVDRVRAEFVEMPGLHLTVPQAARLFGLDQGACRDVLDSLVGASFLRWTTAGAITRAQGHG